LSGLPQTVIHGDLRRANIAFLPDGRVSLFDWDFACRAPAAADLAWYWFLHFWCYPPKDGRPPEDRDPLKLYYVHALEEALGGLDRGEFERAWELSWLKVFAQLGFCLVDAVAGKHTAEDAARVRALCRKAIDRAKRIVDTHVG
jgi:aminoglycoside phosphotransferase (APT) family kinase protein